MDSPPSPPTSLSHHAYRKESSNLSTDWKEKGHYHQVLGSQRSRRSLVLGVGALGKEVTELVPMITFTLQLRTLGLQRAFILTISLLHIITTVWVETARPILERMKLRVRKVIALAQWPYCCGHFYLDFPLYHTVLPVEIGRYKRQRRQNNHPPFPADAIDPFS